MTTRRLLLPACLLGIAWAVPGAAVLVSTLLLPGVAALLMQGRQAGGVRASLLFGGSASITPLGTLLHAGGGLGAAWPIVGEPRVIALAWGAAGLGWLAAELLPIAIVLAADVSARRRRQQLEEVRQRLLREWRLDS